MNMLETIVGVLGAAMLGVIGWAVQLHSRVAVVEAQRDDLKELIEARFDSVERRLARIEQKMNGQLR